jgi:hypothetical protein
MNFIDAAVNVLARAQRPLHYKEIAEAAQRDRLLAHVGRTPESTMNALLQARARSGVGEPRLVRQQTGMFTLDPMPPPPPPPPEPEPAAEVRSARGDDDGDGREAREDDDEDRSRRRRRRGRGGRGGEADEAVAAAGEAADGEGRFERRRGRFGAADADFLMLEPACFMVEGFGEGEEIGDERWALAGESEGESADRRRGRRRRRGGERGYEGGGGRSGERSGERRAPRAMEATVAAEADAGGDEADVEVEGDRDGGRMEVDAAPDAAGDVEAGPYGGEAESPPGDDVEAAGDADDEVGRIAERDDAPGADEGEDEGPGGAGERGVRRRRRRRSDGGGGAGGGALEWLAGRTEGGRLSLVDVARAVAAAAEGGAVSSPEGVLRDLQADALARAHAGRLTRCVVSPVGEVCSSRATETGRLRSIEGRLEDAGREYVATVGRSAAAALVRLQPDVFAALMGRLLGALGYGTPGVVRQQGVTAVLAAGGPPGRPGVLTLVAPASPERDLPTRGDVSDFMARLRNADAGTRAFLFAAERLSDDARRQLGKDPRGRAVEVYCADALVRLMMDHQVGFDLRVLSVHAMGPELRAVEARGA